LALDVNGKCSKCRELEKSKIKNGELKQRMNIDKRNEI